MYHFNWLLPLALTIKYCCRCSHTNVCCPYLLALTIKDWSSSCSHTSDGCPYLLALTIKIVRLWSLWGITPFMHRPVIPQCEMVEFTNFSCLCTFPLFGKCYLLTNCAFCNLIFWCQYSQLTALSKHNNDLEIFCTIMKWPVSCFFIKIYEKSNKYLGKWNVWEKNCERLILNSNLFIGQLFYILKKLSKNNYFLHGDN